LFSIAQGANYFLSVKLRNPPKLEMVLMSSTELVRIPVRDLGKKCSLFFVEQKNNIDLFHDYTSRHDILNTNITANCLPNILGCV
jgi:hypothetical protein